jgi:hypothetical protein
MWCCGRLVRIIETPKDIEVGVGGWVPVEKGVWDPKIQGLTGMAV